MGTTRVGSRLPHYALHRRADGEQVLLLERQRAEPSRAYSVGLCVGNSTRLCHRFCEPSRILFRLVWRLCRLCPHLLGLSPNAPSSCQNATRADRSESERAAMSSKLQYLNALGIDVWTRRSLVQPSASAVAPTLKEATDAPLAENSRATLVETV